MKDRRVHWIQLEGDAERRNTTRRQHRRVEVELTVQCTVGSTSDHRRATNLSAGGLYLRSARTFPVGARPLLEFRLPGDDKPIRCFGEIRNHVEALLPGMNVAFRNISLGDQLRLQRYVDAVEPLRKPAEKTWSRPEPTARTSEMTPDFEYKLDLDLDEDDDQAFDSALLAELKAEIEAEEALEAEEELELDPETDLELESIPIQELELDN